MSKNQNISLLLNAKWREEQAAVVNGLLFEDGRLYRTQKDGTISQTIFSLADATAETWSFLIERSFVVDRENNIRYSCGEGSWGGDGYVAASVVDGERLVWVACFDYSNPFEKIILNAGRVDVTNNHGDIWSFDLRAPWKMGIVAHKK